MKLGRQFRHAVIDTRNVDEGAQTVRVSFSSETPVERYWAREILDHSEKSVRLGRLRDGGAVLLEHDRTALVGVVEAVDLKDSKGYATLRFSKSEAGKAAFAEVKDGIRRNVSVGYDVHKAVLESEIDGVKTYRVTDWEPMEVSLVAIPADPTVGVGRSETQHTTEVILENHKMEAEEKKKPDTSQVEVNQRALADEKARVANIIKLGERFKCPSEATSAVVNGKSFEDFREEILVKIERAQPATPAPALPEMEKSAKRSYSFIRAINVLSNNEKLDGFEGEVEAELRQRSRNPKGVLFPCEVFGIHRRTMTASVGSAGGYTVSTDILGSEFIQKLDNMPVIEKLGARRLSGLTGDVVLVKQTGGATAYWLGEAASATVSDLAFGQLVLTPNRLQVVVPLTKQLMIQSSLDVEALAREDAGKRLAIAQDLAAFQGLGNAGQPKGLFEYDTATSGINTVTYGAAAAFAKINEQIAAIGTDNVMGAPSFVIDWTSWAKWRAKSLDAGSGKFLWEGTGEDGNVTGYKGCVSQHLPSNKSVCGVFSEMILATWDGVDVIVDPYSRKREGIVEISATVHTDIAVRYPQAFCVSTDSAAQ